MIDDFTGEEEHTTIFESFSDVALCTLVVALLLVTLLAVNITQKLNVDITRNHFSGGVMRPSLHLECTTPDFSATTASELAVERALFSHMPYVAVHLFSPSLALIATDVRDGGTVALGVDQTFARQQDLSLYQFMQLSPGIDPGSFEAEGQQTALLLPSILDKQMVYEPASSTGYRANADPWLTKRMLAALWPVYGHPIFPERRPEEFSHARTRVYVEAKIVEGAEGEEHYIVIGHAVYKLPEALDDGSLAWLGGFSSGLTELVYLGETWGDAARRTNKRIEFFKEAGFNECAEAYREYAFPSRANPECDPLLAKLDQLGYPSELAGNRARNALVQIQASDALLNGHFEENSGGFHPPLQAHPDAWKAYIENCKNEGIDPPSWFYREFLDRLGFDRLAIERAAL